jgi:hypothetical protein
MNRPGDDPAIESYWFGKAYLDLRNTIKECWRQNGEDAQHYFTLASRPQQPRVLKVGFWLALVGAGVSVFLFGTALFLALSALHVVIVLVIAGCIMLGYLTVLGIEKVYILYKGWRSFCPACSHPIPLPEFLCPHCDAVHACLIPSRYGILYRRCSKCYKKIPATLLTGRNALPCRCPQCKHPLNSVVTRTRTRVVPLLGGTSAGKTAFLLAAVTQFLQYCEHEELECVFADEQVKKDFGRTLRQLAKGIRHKTAIDKLPRAFDLLFEKEERSLYLYDPAGEVFQSTESLAEHRFHGFPTGYIFVIDPFSIMEVSRESSVPRSSQEDTVRASSDDPQDVFSRFLIASQEHFDLAADSRIKTPLAVVLTKVDAGGLLASIKKKHKQMRSEMEPEDYNQPRGYDMAVRELLLEWNQAALVQQIETRFVCVRYFACSALNSGDDGQLQPRFAVEPLVWVLRQADDPLGAGWENLGLPR